MANVKIDTTDYIDRLHMFQKVKDISKGAAIHMAEDLGPGNAIAPVLLAVKDGVLVSYKNNPEVADEYEEFISDTDMHYLFAFPPSKFEGWLNSDTEDAVVKMREWVSKWLSDYKPDGYMFVTEVQGYKAGRGEKFADVVMDYKEGNHDKYNNILCVGTVWGLAMGEQARINMDVAPIFEAIETRAVAEWEVANHMYGQVGEAFYIPKWHTGSNRAPAKSSLYHYSKTFDKDFLTLVPEVPEVGEVTNE